MYSPHISAFGSSYRATRMIIQLQAGTIFKEVEGYLYPEESLQSLIDLKGITYILN